MLKISYLEFSSYKICNKEENSKREIGQYDIRLIFSITQYNTERDKKEFLKFYYAILDTQNSYKEKNEDPESINIQDPKKQISFGYWMEAYKLQGEPALEFKIRESDYEQSEKTARKIMGLMNRNPIKAFD